MPRVMSRPVTNYIQGQAARMAFDRDQAALKMQQLQNAAFAQNNYVNNLYKMALAQSAMTPRQGQLYQYMQGETPVWGSAQEARGQPAVPRKGQTINIGNDPQFRLKYKTPEQTGRWVQSMQDRSAALKTQLALTQRLVNDMAARPETLGSVGAILRAVEEVRSFVGGIAQATGVRPYQSVEEYNAVFDRFKGAAGLSTANKRTLLDLVFLDLQSKGQTGRAVSDRDLEIFMQAAGFDSGSPQQVIAGLSTAADNATAGHMSALSPAARTLYNDDVIPLEALGVPQQGFPKIESQQVELERIRNRILNGTATMEDMDIWEQSGQ